MARTSRTVIAFCTSDAESVDDVLDESWRSADAVELMVYGAGSPPACELLAKSDAPVRINHVTPTDDTVETVLNGLISGTTGSIVIDVTRAMPYHAALSGMYAVNRRVTVVCRAHGPGEKDRELTMPLLDYSSLDREDALIVDAVDRGAETVKGVCDTTGLNSKTAYRRVASLAERGLITVNSERKQKILSLDKFQARMLAITRDEPRRSGHVPRERARPLRGPDRMNTPSPLPAIIRIMSGISVHDRRASTYCNTDSH